MSDQNEEFDANDAQEFHREFKQSEDIKNILEEVKDLRKTVKELKGIKEEITDMHSHTRTMAAIMSFWLFLSIASLIGFIYYFNKIAAALDLMSKAFGKSY